jgi:butyryl-CoA dehydrogenase
MTDLLSRRDVEFLLFDLLDVAGLCAAPRFSMHDEATFQAVLDQAFTLAQDVFAPFAARLDADEPRFDGEQVHIIPELRAAIEAYVEAGFPAMGFSEALGGSQLPFTVAMTAGLVFTAANAPAQNYAFLTSAAANLISVFGTPAQVETYARPLIEGRWFGTMALSETQAGSSLGDIATRAEPDGQGAYRLTGAKMWISGAEHELSENIVNLVLARLPDAPPGVKGISLFITPKYLPDADGRPGVRNGVRLVGLNRKMGQRGTTNCVLAFGADEPCTGFLVGEPNKGLAYMFHMMNEARIGVGAAASIMACRGYQEALAYAKERRQGRRLDAKRADAPPAAIIEHPDVQRMLLAQKAIAEGSLALCLYCARLVDEMAASDDEVRRADLELLLQVLTPIAKTWPSERGCEANSLAIQVHGGYGYTHDFPVERLYRDQRLNPIHEGTTGVQGLDLLGRKMAMAGGRGAALLADLIGDTAREARERSALAAMGAELEAALSDLQRTTLTLLTRAAGDPVAGLGEATPYLMNAGTVVIAWMWLRMALLAEDRAADDAFFAGKLAACRYVFRWELPLARAQFAVLVQPHDLLTAPAEIF